MDNRIEIADKLLKAIYDNQYRQKNLFATLKEFGHNNFERNKITFVIAVILGTINICAIIIGLIERIADKTIIDLLFQK